MHCVKFSPDGCWLFAADLGTDRLLRWPVRTDGMVDEAGVKTFEVAAGSGPRHFVFDAAGENLYLINERSGTVMVFGYNGDGDGGLRLRQTVQADTAGGHGSADIVMTPDGRFLYASNRLKNDGVAIFSVSPEGRNADGSGGGGTEGGLLTPAGYRPTGIHPRNLCVTPDGRFLAVAARDSGTVEFMAIDPLSGALTPSGRSVSLDKPVCVLFVPATF
jgi:6-phosphogluconolactonase (cycloisomerase 2 family)